MSKLPITITTLVLLFCTTLSHSSESLIDDIAKREKVSSDEVRNSIENGCDSGVTPYMSACMHYHWVGEDIKLNRAYQTLMKQLGTKAAKLKLVKAQHAWLAFRNAACEFDSDGMSSGTGYSVLYKGCLASMTTERTTKLNEYLKCQDSGCPGTGFE